MNELIENIVLFLVVYFIVRIATSALKEHLEEKILAREEMIDKLHSMIHQVAEEKHGDLTYWFDAETDAFLTQGANKAELIEGLKQRFKGKGHMFLVSEKELIAGPDFETIDISDGATHVIDRFAGKV
jgi:hypothetical protein